MGNTSPKHLTATALPPDAYAVAATRGECARASRYLATVRRAMSIPDACKFWAIASSDSTTPRFSAAMSALMRWRTASDEWVAVPSAPLKRC